MGWYAEFFHSNREYRTQQVRGADFVFQSLEFQSSLVSAQFWALTKSIGRNEN